MDREIRTGLRYALNLHPELLAGELGVDGSKRLFELAKLTLAHSRHDDGNCRHCYPRIFTNAEGESDHRSVIKDGVVTSSSCREGGVGHQWCGNRNWTECNCGCECHCLKKQNKSRVR